MTKEKKWGTYVYGDVNIDLIVPGVEELPKPGQEAETEIMETFVGGGAALFALGLGKLGLHPVFGGLIGDDCYGQFIRETFQKTGVDDSLLSTKQDKKTGISISFTNEKERCFLTFRGTNEELDLDNICFGHVEEAGHIHVTGYAGSKNHQKYERLLSHIKKETKATVSFDVGWDASEEWNQDIYQLFPYIDVLFMNETEAIHYGRCESASEAALDFSEYCGLAVIKLGKKGALAARKCQSVYAAAFTADAVDTTGAGDSFNAGFVYGFLKKKTPEECLSYGNACGALSVTALGGNTAFPLEKQLLQYVASQNK